MFAFTSFVGFESAALYGEETKDPERSIPRATYIAVVTIGDLLHPDHLDHHRRRRRHPGPRTGRRAAGQFRLQPDPDAGGTVLYDLAAVLFCTSVLASALAAAQRGQPVPVRPRPGTRGCRRRLGRTTRGTRARTSRACGSPGWPPSSTLAMAVFGADPYTVFATSFIGLGTLGIIALQAAAALAVVVFFWRRPDRNLWRCVIAPLIGFVGLGNGFRPGRHPLQHPHRVDQRAGRRGARVADRRRGGRRGRRAAAASHASPPCTPPSPASHLRRRAAHGRARRHRSPTGGGTASSAPDRPVW